MDMVGQNPSGAPVWLRCAADGSLSAGFRAEATVTRPANVTPYTALDVVGGRFELPNAGPAGGFIRVLSAALRIDIAAVPAGMTTFRLHLYNAAPASNLADNAPFDIPAGDRAAYLGFVDLPAAVDLGATLQSQVDNIHKILKLASGQTSLWGYLVTTGAFTPAANSEVYVPALGAITA
jgi:hypothetical protein